MGLVGVSIGIALTLSACAEIQAFSDKASKSDPVDFPAELTNLMSNSVPVVNKHLTYPRLAVSLTDTRQFSVPFLGIADHGHFKVTEWKSPTEMKVIEFNISLTKAKQESTFHTNLYDNIAYMDLSNDNWRSVEATGGNASSDFQPMNTHWFAGPEAAQFFVPPVWLPALKNTNSEGRLFDGSPVEIEASLIEAFLADVGVYGKTVDPRVWFYEVDQAR